MRRAISRQLRAWGYKRFNGQVQGRRFAIPSLNGAHLEIAEPWMQELLKRLFPLKPGTFLDVGVNLGQTLLVVAAIDPERPYIGFEPNPACVDYAERLIRANGLDAYRLIPAGLSDQTGVVMLDLFHDSGTDDTASIVPGYRPGEAVKSRKAVMVVAPADLPPELLADPVGVVKIDVEGAEKEVLTGLIGILKRDRPLITVEVLPAYSTDYSHRIARQAAIEALMDALDYRIFRLTEKRPLRAQRIPCIGIHDDLDQCEYLMVPAEASEAVARAINDG